LARPSLLTVVESELSGFLLGFSAVVCPGSFGVSLGVSAVVEVLVFASVLGLVLGLGLGMVLLLLLEIVVFSLESLERSSLFKSPEGVPSLFVGPSERSV
jgi:hypothetical protein